jgi:hypothetical protein
MLARQVVTQASIPARRRINKTASAQPLILTFSPAAKNAAKAKEYPVLRD